MRPFLFGFNAVVLARLFNPSVMREPWLRSVGALLDDDILQPGFVFSDQAVIVTTGRFTLAVVPHQLQIAPVDAQVGGTLVPDLAERLLGALPHTPFSAVGVNFVWHIDLEGQPAETITRRLFFSDRNPLAHDFLVEDAQFGLYMSKNVQQSRLKLDVRPVTAQTLDASALSLSAATHPLQLTFNYHHDVDSESKSTPLEQVMAPIKLWSHYADMAEKMVSAVVSAT